METIKVLKLHPEALIPTRNKAGDAGLDLYALEDCFIPIGTKRIVKTGVAVEIPFGFVGKIEDRSSMGAKGLRTSAGVIDNGYTGEVGVILNNLSADVSMKEFQAGYQINAGDKVAQLLVYPIALPKPVEVKELEKTDRGNQGYGSSGR